MNKVEFRKGHVPKGKLIAQKVFKKKVENALTSDFPLIKSIYFGGASFAGNLDVQAYNQIPMMDVGQLEQQYSDITNNALVSNDAAGSFICRDYRIDGFYSNASNTLCIMDWYLVVPRRDMLITPVQDWATAMNQNLANNGEMDPNSKIAGAAAYTLGLTPFDSSQFCTDWLILEKRRVMIQPGETKEFHRGVHKQKTVETAKFREGINKFTALKGITSYYFIMQYGQPVHDTSSYNIGTSPTRVDVQYNIQMQGTAMAAPAINDRAGQRRVVVQTAVPAAITTAATRDEFSPAAVITATNV